jgi:hypothetical protein
LVVIHHGTSEEWGVRRLAQIFAEKFPELPVRLLPQGCTFRWIPARTFNLNSGVGETADER